MTGKLPGYRGACRYCKQNFTKRQIKTHLFKCPERVKLMEKKSEEGVLLFAESAEFYDFWLLLEVERQATLKQLDTFLRYIWLECCGHLSAFRKPNSWGDISMNRKIGDIYSQTKTSIGYEYDFGTTTALKITCLGEIEMPSAKQKIILAARNLLPEVMKDCKCGTRATMICNECRYESDDAFLCVKCAKKCGHEEEMMLPVVNSPRAGECGYEGNGMELAELFPKGKYGAA